jgi:hypothetical protein
LNDDVFEPTEYFVSTFAKSYYRPEEIRFLRGQVTEGTERITASHCIPAAQCLIKEIPKRRGGKTVLEFAGRIGSGKRRFQDNLEV